MARTVKDNSTRRNQILDVAQQLVYTKGYEQMTIQDLLDTLNISKGAFYHYFDSKPALLEALIERMIDEVKKIIQPIVDDQRLTALEKFERYFDTVSRWKTAQKDFLLAILRVWYNDNNAIVRQKVLTTGTRLIAPVLSSIILQGIQEGVFTNPYPDRIGEVVFTMMMGFSDNLAQDILNWNTETDNFSHLENTLAVVTDALERVLGAQKDSIHLIDKAVLKEWLIPASQIPTTPPLTEKVSVEFKGA